MTKLNVQQDSRTADIVSPARLEERPLTAFLRPRGVGQALSAPGARYSPQDLMGEVYFELWDAGRIPDGPMRDPAAAHRAAADLLRAFGVEVSE